jgi:hypothetical protein
MDLLFQSFCHKTKADTALYNSILPALELTLWERGKFWVACKVFRKKLLEALKPLKESEIKKKINDGQYKSWVEMMKDKNKSQELDHLFAATL